MNDTIRAAREHNVRAPINLKLANENLRDIFLALAYLDTPSLLDPLGWYPRVCGVCWLWRDIAIQHSSELWAHNAGSFPSRHMTDVMIQRAGVYPTLDLSGHFEDHNGPGYVLTDYQISLIETHVARLRSLVHDDYIDWSKLFYRLRSFPTLETARIWDDSGPDMWRKCIEAPRLECLYLNNGLIPFNARALRYLRVDMDNIDWRASRDVYRTQDEPMADSCAAKPRVFPTLELIDLLQRSPGLERLVITNMPLLISKDLPTISELHARLPCLRGLHLSGQSHAMGDLWSRLVLSRFTRVCFDYVSTPWGLHDIDISDAIEDILSLPIYDCLRLGMTPSYDLMLQLWSSKTHHAHALEICDSLLLTETSSGPAFTLRRPVGSRELLKSFPDYDDETYAGSIPPVGDVEDSYMRFQKAMAKQFYKEIFSIFQHFSSSTIVHIDLTDIPFVDYEQLYTGDFVKPDAPMRLILQSPVNSISSRKRVVLNWSLITCMRSTDRMNPPDRLNDFYLTETVVKLTIVNFPCASFASRKRYNAEYNERAWDELVEICEEWSKLRHRDRVPLYSLTLAESDSESSNMERSEESEFEFADDFESYADALRDVDEKGYQRIAPFVVDFRDIRAHTWC